MFCQNIILPQTTQMLVLVVTAQIVEAVILGCVGHVPNMTKNGQMQGITGTVLCVHVNVIL